MRWRVFALVSLGVNLVLVGGLWLSTRTGPDNLAGGIALTNLSGPVTITNTLVRRQFFSWHDIESPDYANYIANLRDIACPEQTIRDIIIADVNALFSRRRALELLTSEQQWWRSEPDSNVVQAAAEKSRALEDERRALLTRLLGTNWETGDLVSLPRPSRQGILLDGPVLGALPVETKQAVESVSMRSQDRLQAYFEALRRDGKEVDPLEVAKLRQQTRVELEHILPPAQLEEFLLRYSQNANDLRSDFGQLRFFDPTPDEFRQVFRSTDYLDQQIQMLSGSDPDVAAQRKALEDQRENAIKIALGPKRYEEYRMLQDPLYRDAVATAQDAGTPEAARTIYQVNLASALQQAAINSETNFTDEQRAVQLKQLEADQLKANTLAVGQDLPPEPPSTPSNTRQPRVHLVGPGDSLATISLLYGVPVGAIRAANPNIDFNTIRPGSALNIPPTVLRPNLPFVGPPR